MLKVVFDIFSPNLSMKSKRMLKAVILEHVQEFLVIKLKVKDATSFNVIDHAVDGKYSMKSLNIGSIFPRLDLEESVKFFIRNENKTFET
jgi:hypothetical protein